MSPNPTRAAIYARTATGPVLDQVGACAELARRRGWTVTQEYCDEAASGLDATRSALAELLVAAAQQPRPFDVVVLADLARLSRRREDVARTLEGLSRLGVSVETLDGPVPTTPSTILSFRPAEHP